MSRTMRMLLGLALGATLVLWGCDGAEDDDTVDDDDTAADDDTADDDDTTPGDDDDTTDDDDTAGDDDDTAGDDDDTAGDDDDTAGDDDDTAAGVDNDGDGYNDTVDCDDNDAAINPGAAEVLDGVDQDCDGLVDEDFVVAGDIVITEIMNNPAAVDDGNGEFFEIHNAAGFDIDLTGWWLADLGTDSHEVSPGMPLVIAAGGYLVLGINDDVATNGGVPVDYSYGGDMSLANGTDEIVLQLDGLEIDSVVYDDGATFPDPSGASMNLDPTTLDAVANDDGANWCESTTDMGTGDFGTPGAANDVCSGIVDADGDGYDNTVDCDDTDPDTYPGAPELCDGADNDCNGILPTNEVSDYDGDGYLACEDCDDNDAAVHPGAVEDPGNGIDDDCDGLVDEATVAIDVGDVIFTEVLQNPSATSDNDGEWFEVYNTTGANVDLMGCVITDYDSDSHTIAGSVLVAAMDYAVLGANADSGTNGGVTVDYEYGGDIALANGDDEVVLTCNGVMIDDIAYDGGSTWPDPNGASMTLDPTMFDGTLNDDGTHWCEAVTPFGSGDLGTPGSGNDPC